MKLAVSRDVRLIYRRCTGRAGSRLRPAGSAAILRRQWGRLYRPRQIQAGHRERFRRCGPASILAYYGAPRFGLVKYKYVSWASRPSRQAINGIVLASHHPPNDTELWVSSPQCLQDEPHDRSLNDRNGTLNAKPFGRPGQIDDS